jgi:nitric oxide dioxygenase
VLSNRSRPVIEATLPAVAENIGEIARRFYAHMFDAHPELLDGTFNRGNQAEGTQQVALAGSVAAFASALVHTPEQLPDHLLNRIAHKHATLGIRPDQYQVVYDNLFWAIADVLGEAVTPEVAEAWDEVYWLMAYALINRSAASTAPVACGPRRSGAPGRWSRRSPRPTTWSPSWSSGSTTGWSRPPCPAST